MQIDINQRNSHYENTPIQIYYKFYHKKNNENFQIKNSDIFHISARNIDCGHSLEDFLWVLVRTASPRF